MRVVVLNTLLDPTCVEKLEMTKSVFTEEVEESTFIRKSRSTGQCKQIHIL